MDMKPDSVNTENVKRLYPTLPRFNDESGGSETEDANNDDANNDDANNDDANNDDDNANNDDSNANTNNEGTKPSNLNTQQVYLENQLYAAFAVSMGSLVTGFSFGFITHAIFGILLSPLHVSWEEISWFIYVSPLSAVLGSLVGCPLIERLGRRKTIMASALPLMIGWTLIVIGWNMICFWIGQALCGIGIGIISFTVPVYLVESIHPKIRGALGVLPSTMQHIGMLFAALLGNYVNWSILACVGFGLSLSFFLLMFGTLDTPSWYVVKGRTDDAVKSLQWFRGINNNIENEIQDLTRYQSELDKVKGNSCGQLFKLEYMPAVLTSLGLIIFQQLSGYKLVIYCSATFVNRYEIFHYENALNIILGITHLLSSLLAFALIDRLGRKKLLFISSGTMIMTLTSLGIFFYVHESNIAISPPKWMLIACLVVYITGYSMGFEPIPWLMIGEILPTKIRGTAAALCAGFNWASIFYLTRTSQNVIDNFNTYGTMWFYAAMCSTGMFFILFFVPETKGRSLEDIEKEMTDDSPSIRNMNDVPA